jgi:RNA polymerase sigma factor (TIGR02999 family)
MNHSIILEQTVAPVPPPQNQVTQLLVAWTNGDHAALDKLLPLVYDELRRMARHQMRRQRPGHTLQTTALVHEAFLKLVNHPEKQWHNRGHFLGVAARAMRHVLVDYARTRQCAKRGGAFAAVSLEEGAVVSVGRAGELIALDDALSDLAVFDPRKSRVVELLVFGGLSAEEIAQVLKVSADTIRRDWRLARTWLRRELSNKGTA